MKRTFKDYLSVTLKGIAMGAADVIPGVSGGTIAFITGIYQELINSIKSVNLTTLKLLLTGKVSGFWKAVNGNFLFSLVLGIGLSILSLAKGMQYLLDHHPILIWSFFFGLIIASAIYVAKDIKGWKAGTVVSLIFGIAVAYMITVITPAEANTSYGFIFLSGAIAICAMILPGISGSFILVLLGMYRFILGAVAGFNLPVILIFLTGAIIGIILFSNLLSWLLQKYYTATIAMLSGFMVGSLNKVWPWKEVTETFIDRHGVIKPLMEQNVLPGNYFELTGNNPQLGYALSLAAFGFALIFIIEGISKKIKK
jgi:putative membrane protein